MMQTDNDSKIIIPGQPENMGLPVIPWSTIRDSVPEEVRNSPTLKRDYIMEKMEPRNTMSRRGFLKGLLSVGLVAATPKIIIDMGANLRPIPAYYIEGIETATFDFGNEIGCAMSIICKGQRYRHAVRMSTRNLYRFGAGITGDTILTGNEESLIFNPIQEAQKQMEATLIRWADEKARSLA